MPLLTEPDTADLRDKVAGAWREFARALEAALPDLPEGAVLDLTLDPSASGTGDAVYAVTVTAGPDGTWAARAVGNASLPEGYQLNRAAVADMVALGWSPPGVEPGSGDQFGLTVHGRADGAGGRAENGTAESGARRLAVVLARTLRDIYGAPHPAFLVYLAVDEGQEPVAVPPLGSARVVTDELEPAEPAPPAAGESAPVAVLREQVQTVVAAMLRTSPDQLTADPDGDIGIRAGTAMVFVKVRDDPPLVDVLSPVLTGVTPTEQLYGKLSELTNRMPVGRLYCANGTVWASVPVFGRNFQPSHLVLAVQVMTGLADELDDRLHGEFGGRRFFGEDDTPANHPREDAASTGMYL